jgi:hypothetical protein
MFPTPRIPTDQIPERGPHIERGDHLRLYRFSPSDFRARGRPAEAGTRFDAQGFGILARTRSASRR